VWLHYARAFLYYGVHRFPEARASLDEALALDPGHLPCMRLEATMLAGAGEEGLASDVLELWLDRSADDPLVSSEERAEASVDLALLRVLSGSPSTALATLRGIQSGFVDRCPRALLVRAAAHAGRGELEEARQDARRASQLAPDDALPLVQQALLIEGGRRSEAEELALWEELLEQSRAARSQGAEGVDLASLLYQLQAHARIERLRAEAAGEADPAR
jgi:predicted Zn-dependent protease